MLEQQRTFGEALAEWMRASGVSTKRLAERTGYKSKTSIVRILREEGVHAGRERLLEQLRKQDLLDPAAYASLAQALEISRVGPARARGRMCLRRLLVGRREAELSPSLMQALEPLRQARSARMLLLNGCRVELTEELRRILRQRPAHVMEHYVSVDFSSERAMEALCAILAIACVPAYACAIREMRPDRREELLRQDMLCFIAQDRDGVSADTLVLFPGDDSVRVHTQPSSFGLFDFLRRILVEGDFQPAVGAYATQEGPESIVEAMRFCTELERGCNARTVKPDVCINEVPGAVLFAALRDGGVLHHFPGWTERQMRAQLEEFFYYHDQRFRSAFEGERMRGRIMSPRSLRRFVLTGRFDSPFPAIRAFTVAERVAILENFARHIQRDGGCPLCFWSDADDLTMEIHCFENVGIIAFPAREAGGLNVNFQTSILRHPRMAALFEECFDDDLTRNCAISPSESLLYLRSLLDELRATP